MPEEMTTIRTFLTFESQALPAVLLYTSLVENSEILEVTYYPEGGPVPSGTVLTVAFRLGDQQYVALNGPKFEFTDAFSICVQCDTQEEIDRLWDGLAEGGEPIACGWIRDRFGVTWQVCPRQLVEWMSKGDEAAGRVMQTIMGMTKLNLDAIRDAYESALA